MKRNKDTLNFIALLFDDDEDSLLEILQCIPFCKRNKTRELIANREKEGAFYILISKYLFTEEDNFMKYFRLSPHLFNQILESIRNDITTKSCKRVSNPISAEQKLCLTLRYLSARLFLFHQICKSRLFYSRYLATGESHSSLAFSFRISQSWISMLIKQVLTAVRKNMFSALPTPTKDQFISIANSFSNKWNFPHVIGCLDGKHIRIRCPNRSGSLYYNYKDFFSIVLFALVDAKYKFIAVDIGSFGREGDAGCSDHMLHDLKIDSK